MKNLFNRFVREDAGQDLIEYALLAGIISLGCVVMLGTLSQALQDHFSAVGTAVGNAS